MRYKFELSVMTAMLFGLLLAGAASADSVTKTLYVDGVKLGTSAATQSISFPYPRLTIGAEGSRYFRYNGLVGEIDEFAVFGRDLNDTDVAALYGAGAGGYVTAVSNANPLLYLRFEDASSANGSKLAHSGSLADVNSTYIGAISLDASGFVGKAAVLHGATDGNGDCIDVCDWDQQLSQSDISVAFWVKTTQASDYPRLFQHNGGSTEERSYGAMYNAGTNSIGLIGGGATGYVNAVLNDGTWHHVAVTFNSIVPGPYAAEVLADDPCVYLKFDNQMLVDSSINHWWVGRGLGTTVQKTAGSMGSALYEDNTLMFGSTPHPDSAAYTWNNWFADPTGHFTREGPPFGGNNDGYAFAPDDISFELWIKSVPNLTQGDYTMIFQQVGAYTREPNGPALGDYNDAGVFKLRVAAGSQWYYPGTNTPLDGMWHQLVVTYDQNDDGLGKSMVVQLYLDGSLAGQSEITDPNGNARLKGELSVVAVGCNNDQGWFYSCYGGYVDEFAIYQGVLSPERVAAHYAAWQPKDCADVKARGMTLLGDFNGDCQVDLYDYATFASQWRLCDNPSNPSCGHNW